MSLAEESEKAANGGFAALFRIDPENGTITDAIPIGSTRMSRIRLGRVAAVKGAVLGPEQPPRP